MKRFKNKIVRMCASIFRYGLLILVLYYVGNILAQHLRLMDFSKLNLSISYLIAAAIFEIFARFFVGLGYHQLLMGFKTPLPLPTALSISWISLLGRYFPGKIALIISAVYFLKQQNIPLKIAGIIPVLNTLFTIVAALVLSLPLAHKTHILPPEMEVFLAATLIIAVVLIYNYIDWNNLLRYILKRLGVEAAAVESSYKTIITCSAIALLQCISAGLATWTLCLSLAPIAAETIIWFISITSFSGVMGLIAFFSPAGIGVKDGFYLLFLTQIIGPEKAALVTVLMRLLQTFIDFLLAIIGSLHLKPNHSL